MNEDAEHISLLTKQMKSHFLKYLKSCMVYIHAYLLAVFFLLAFTLLVHYYASLLVTAINC